MQKTRRYFKVKRTAHEIRRYRKREDLAVLRFDPYTRAVLSAIVNKVGEFIRGG